MGQISLSYTDAKGACWTYYYAPSPANALRALNRVRYLAGRRLATEVLKGIEIIGSTHPCNCNYDGSPRHTKPGHYGYWLDLDAFK